MQGFHAYPTRISQHLCTAGRQFVFTASISGGVVDGKKEMLRKKNHVVRKKTHVVRKLFYVASIFGGAAGRRNRPPWKLSSTPWTLSSTAGDFSSTAARCDACNAFTEHPCFGRDAPTRLPDTNHGQNVCSIHKVDGGAERLAVAAWGPKRRAGSGHTKAVRGQAATPGGGAVPAFARLRGRGWG